MYLNIYFFLILVKNIIYFLLKKKHCIVNDIFKKNMFPFFQIFFVPFFDELFFIRRSRKSNPDFRTKLRWLKLTRLLLSRHRMKTGEAFSRELDPIVSVYWRIILKQLYDILIAYWQLHG